MNDKDWNSASERQSFPIMRGGKWGKLWVARNGSNWGFRVTGATNEIVAQSTRSYKTRSAALNAAKRSKFKL